MAGALTLVCRMTEGVAFLVRKELADDAGPREERKPDDVYLIEGFGVVLEFPDGNFSLVFGVLRGVLSILETEPEASEIGGEGGVSSPVLAVIADFDSKGVAINFEQARESRDG